MKDRIATRPLAHDLLIASCLVAVAVASRLLPHPPNFTAITAVALIGGMLISRKLVALSMPLLVMVAADILVFGTYQVALLLVVYLMVMLPVCLGRVPFFNRSSGRLLVTAAGWSLITYLVINLSVWLLTPWYAKDLSGLVACYVAGIPFLKYRLAGDLIWTSGLLAVVFAMRSAMAPRLLPAKDQS